MIMTTYQQQEAIRPKTEKKGVIAIVDSISPEGVSVKFPGDDQPSAKRYQYNTSLDLYNGARVYMVPISGTYIAAFLMD